ncbi:SUMF1/EgtB/PvdO family nonheme iron enzyme [bacterium]|nr:SUMF1/EgtB/PvdO family nonheme iron enzyme [bacterium]
MDLQTWKERIRDRVTAAAGWLRRATPGMTYGALSASTLMPVIAAANSGDFAALVTLTSVVGGVGGNLIANQIQKWHDKNEEQLAAELEQLAVSKPEWREALDTLILELETPRIVQAILGEAEWDRFQLLLRQELATLGNLASYEVYLKEVNTQGGAYTEGNVTVTNGDFVGRDKIIHNHPLAPDPRIEQAKQAEAAYLHMLRRDCNRLPLAEDDRSQTAQAQHRALLSNVYVDLATQSSPSIEQAFDRLGVPESKRVGARKLLKKSVVWDERETGGAPLQKDAWEKVAKHLGVDEKALDVALGPLTALDALHFFPHLVLLGEPGGGKSTFVNHLAYLFAGIHLGQEETLPAPLTVAFFPLRVILRRWSSTLTADSKPGLELAYAALCEATGLTKEVLLRRLAQPNTLVLFDGLDEAPPENADTGLDRRAILVKSVQDFCTAHPDCRVLVTSRIKPYQNKIYRLDDLPIVTLAKLDTERIERFLHNWYAERARVEPDKAAKATNDRDRLLRSLSERPALREMAETPLLLTMLAAVNAWAGLPESRAELYDKCVEQLLWEWEKRKQDEDGESGDSGSEDGLLDLLYEAGLQRPDMERVLWEMTFNAHATSGADTADLPADTLRKKLAAIHPKKSGQDWAWAARVVALMAERGGLLVETDTDIFSFPHRSFQEYLAARWLLEQEDRTAEAARLAESDIWREVVLLGCGYLSYKGSYSDVQAIIHELTGGRRFDTPEKRLRLLVGGQAWAEFGPHRARGNTGEELTERIPERLTQLMQDRHAPPRQRLDAGLLLADLHILPPDLEDFVPILAVDTLGYDFRIGKYPVTNAQFRRFVDDGGYAEDKPWWTNEAVEDLERWGDWRKGPRYWGNPRFDRDTQPVVGVSWYEAVAYCEWLTAQLRALGEIGQNEEIRLPTMKEWMRAARSTHGSEYPWNGDFDLALANTKESNLGQTTPVHMYQNGKSPEDVWDLAGNVWEWSNDRDTDRWPWLKGSSWYNDAKNAQTSARRYGNPSYGSDDLGFRLVVVPITRA